MSAPAMVCGVLLCAVPQEPGPQILSPGELAVLNERARDWFGAWLERALAGTTAARRAAQPAFAEAKAAFLEAWEEAAGQENLLASVPDLREIFRNVFPYPEVGPTEGIVEVPAARELPAFELRLPRAYDARRPYRGIILLPGIDPPKRSAIPAEEYFALTWKGAPVTNDSIFLIPRLSSDPSPDSRVETRDAGVLMKLLGELLQPLAAVQRAYHLDRERLILDCGKGSSAFGVWFASSFPSRCAGLILRWPEDVSELRLGSLTGLPVLVLAGPETRPAAVELARRLNELEDGACVLRDGIGTYPFPGNLKAIEDWTSGVRRKLMRKRIVLEPNSDLYNDGYWAQIVAAEPLALLEPEEQPRLVVEAERARNRISISSRGIRSLSLFLNDELVDLDRPITLVIDGKATLHRRTRSLNSLTETMFNRYDPTWIFTTQLMVAVPK